MNTKLIGILIVLLVVWGGYKVVKYYKEVDARRYQEEQVTGRNLDPTQLAGMPQQLEESLNLAQNQGAAAMREWLATYGAQIRDPRKAWIQLDYCKMIFREDPQEARAVYVSVKDRLTESSPVYPRMKELEKTFD